jgi:hypothetical protein
MMIDLFEKILNADDGWNINHGFMALDENNKLVHFCGYENKPTNEDKEHLRHELRTDESLGLVGKEFTLVYLPVRQIIEWLSKVS